MLSQIGSRLFNQWMAYATIKPFGETRQDYRFAHLIAIIDHMMSTGQQTIDLSKYVVPIDAIEDELPDVDDLVAMFAGWEKTLIAQGKAVYAEPEPKPEPKPERKRNKKGK